MKSLVFQMLICISCLYGAKAESLKIIDGGNSKYVVTVNAGADPQEEKAANLFRYYVKRITNLNLPITADKSLPFRIDFKEDYTLPNGGFRIKNNGSNITIAGGRENGIINAAAYFLKKFFDVTFLSADMVNVPSSKNVEISTPFDILEKPDFQMRTIHSIEGYHQDYVEFNSLQLPFKEYLAFPNTFNIDFLPSSKYLKAHPEYYSLKLGKRDTAQPNIQNEEIADIVKDKVRSFPKISKKSILYYNIFLNDNSFISEDYVAQVNFGKKEENYTDLSLNMVNSVASSFPEKRFLALAYEQTKNIPLKTSLSKNVDIVLTNADNNKSKPIQNDDYDVQQKLHMKDILPKWLSKDPNLIFWDYLSNYNNSIMPWPTLYTVKPNLQYYKETGVKNLMIQLGGLYTSECSELKAYMCTNLMWNTKYNEDSLILDFCNRYYKGSGKTIYDYLIEINKMALNGKDKMFTYDGPEKFALTFFSFKNVKRWRSNLLAAEKRESDPNILKRIMKERVGLDCVYIQLSVNVPGWNKIDSKSKVNQGIDEFLKTINFLGITRLSDSVHNIQEYALSLKQKNN